MSNEFESTLSFYLNTSNSKPLGIFWEIRIYALTVDFRQGININLKSPPELGLPGTFPERDLSAPPTGVSGTGDGFDDR